MSFTNFALDPSLLRGVADLGFSDPTPIQRDGIPPALEGRDVLACAMTGSGKTGLLQVHPGNLVRAGGWSRRELRSCSRSCAPQPGDRPRSLAPRVPTRS